MVIRGEVFYAAYVRGSGWLNIDYRSVLSTTFAPTMYFSKEYATDIAARAVKEFGASVDLYIMVPQYKTTIHP